MFTNHLRKTKDRLKINEVFEIKIANFNLFLFQINSKEFDSEIVLKDLGAKVSYITKPSLTHLLGNQCG